VYSGDGSFTTSQTSFSQVVSQSPSSTNVSFSPSNPVFGQTITLTATVAASGNGAGIPSGNVTFFIGSTSIGSNKLTAGNGVSTTTITYSQLPFGQTTITATYAGDSNFLGSQSGTSGGATVNVAKANSQTAVTSSINPSGNG